MDLVGPRDFKSLASANSATPAVLLDRGVTFYALCVLLCQCYIRVSLGSCPPQIVLVDGIVTHVRLLGCVADNPHGGHHVHPRPLFWLFKRLAHTPDCLPVAEKDAILTKIPDLIQITEDLRQFGR